LHAKREAPAASGQSTLIRHTKYFTPSDGLSYAYNLLKIGMSYRLQNFIGHLMQDTNNWDSDRFHAENSQRTRCN